jgi:hypothetical protein
VKLTRRYSVRVRSWPHLHRVLSRQHFDAIEVRPVRFAVEVFRDDVKLASCERVWSAAGAALWGREQVEALNGTHFTTVLR